MERTPTGTSVRSTEDTQGIGTVHGTWYVITTTMFIRKSLVNSHMAHDTIYTKFVVK